jgi:hypothetical protein
MTTQCDVRAITPDGAWMIERAAQAVQAAQIGCA